MQLGRGRSRRCGIASGNRGDDVICALRIWFEIQRAGNWVEEQHMMEERRGEERSPGLLILGCEVREKAKSQLVSKPGR